MKLKSLFGMFAIITGCFLTAGTAQADAAALWKANCKKCHAEDGKGKTKMGEKMGIADVTTPEWQKEFDDAAIKKTIQEGIKREKDGKKQLMKPFKKLSDEDIEAITKFIRDLAA